MSICKQNKFQLAHLYAERGRARAGRYSSVWKSSSEKHSSGAVGAQSGCLQLLQCGLHHVVTNDKKCTEFFVGT